MTAKEAKTGGAWKWHQDYGYWYQNGCLLPDMGSAFIAVDPNTRANGCLQVLKGSHKMGRVEHGRYGDQTGADPERVEAAEKVMERMYVELDPGDTLFFHSNTLHRSDQNTSDDPRGRLSVATTPNITTLIRSHITLFMRPLKNCPIMR